MATYYITEEATYEVEADSPQAAYDRFINGANDNCEVTERYMTDEQGDVVDYEEDD